MAKPDVAEQIIDRILRLYRRQAFLAMVRKPEREVIRLSQCAGKRRYAYRAEVDKVIARMKRVHAAVMPYKCMVCGGWHVGNKVNKRKFTRKGNNRG